MIYISTCLALCVRVCHSDYIDNAINNASTIYSELGLLWQNRVGSKLLYQHANIQTLLFPPSAQSVTFPKLYSWMLISHGTFIAIFDLFPWNHICQNCGIDGGGVME